MLAGQRKAGFAGGFPRAVEGDERAVARVRAVGRRECLLGVGVEHDAIGRLAVTPVERRPVEFRQLPGGVGVVVARIPDV